MEVYPSPSGQGSQSLSAMAAESSAFFGAALDPTLAAVKPTVQVAWSDSAIGHDYIHPESHTMSIEAPARQQTPTRGVNSRSSAVLQSKAIRPALCRPW